MPYANPDSLVSTEWLAAHLADPAVAIVDATFKLPGVTPTAREEYGRRHIPGAVFFDIDGIADPSSPLPHMLPSEADFAKAVGALGLGEDRRIVIYDHAGLASAPRAWWSLRVFGHRNLAVLDGGLPKWLEEGRPVTAEIPRPAAGRFIARLDLAQLRTKADLLANLDSRHEQVVDARSAARFDGTAAEPRPGLRAGHIPGSRNLPSDLLSHARTHQVQPAERLETLFRNAGLTPAQQVVCSCGSGVTACTLAFGLHLLGWPEAAVYDGSWSEWGLPGDTPVATGAD